MKIKPEDDAFAKALHYEKLGQEMTKLGDHFAAKSFFEMSRSYIEDAAEIERKAA